MYLFVAKEKLGKSCKCSIILFYEEVIPIYFIFPSYRNSYGKVYVCVNKLLRPIITPTVVLSFSRSVWAHNGEKMFFSSWFTE